MKELIKLAHYLDQNEMHHFADKIDYIIKKAQINPKFVEKQPDLVKIEKSKNIPNDLLYYAASITQGTKSPKYDATNAFITVNKLNSMKSNPDVQANFPNIYKSINDTIDLLKEKSFKDTNFIGEKKATEVNTKSKKEENKKILEKLQGEKESSFLSDNQYTTFSNKPSKPDSHLPGLRSNFMSDLVGASDWASSRPKIKIPGLGEIDPNQIPEWVPGSPGSKGFEVPKVPAFGTENIFDPSKWF